MKAAILYEPNTPLRVEDVTFDEPQENEILVKLMATGLCNSDLHFMKGEMPVPVPVVMGHEGAGVVEKVARRRPTPSQRGPSVAPALRPRLLR